MNDKVYTIDEIKNIIAPIAKSYGVQKVFLFGSYARGEATASSDLDFCIDAPSIRDLFMLGGLYADLEDAFSKKLDLITVGSLKYNSDTRFINNLNNEQILVYEYVE